MISISIGLVYIVTRQTGSFFFPTTKHVAILSGDAYKGKKKKNFNLEMERMIKQQIFALEMDALTNRLQRLQLDNKIVTLLHELWDKMKIGGRRKVEVTDHLLSLHAQSEDQPLLDQLGNIFDSLVDEMTAGMADNDLVRFVLQRRSLDYPISLPFMPRHEMNAERIMGEVQRVLQSNEQVSLQSGMQVHVVHVGMPQGGVASRKRKHYGFKLAKFLDNKKSVLRIQNKDSLCLARAIVTDVARQDKDPEWNSIRMGRKEQRLLAQQLHQKANIQEGLCGIPEVDKFQKVIDNYQIIVLSAKHFNAIVYKGLRREKQIYLSHAL